MSNVKYPNVKVKLVGEDGNAYSIMGRVQKAMRLEKLPPEAFAEYQKEAMSGNHGHLLATTMRYVSCDEDEEDECEYCGEVGCASECLDDEEEDE